MIHLISLFLFNFFFSPPLCHFDFEGDVSGSGEWNTICLYIFICVTAEVYLKQTRPTVFCYRSLSPRGDAQYICKVAYSCKINNVTFIPALDLKICFFQYVTGNTVVFCFL